MKKKKAAKRKAKKKVKPKAPEKIVPVSDPIEPPEPFEPNEKQTLRLSDLQANVPHSHAGGIKCSNCGCAHWRVIYTRDKPGRIMRRRECRHCQKRITTYEQTS